LFDEVYEAVEEFVDEIAERCASLGGAADGTLSGIRSRTELPEYPYQIACGHDHVDALSDSLAAFGKLCREAIETSDNAGDAATADLFTQVVREVDKFRWFVESHNVGRESETGSGREMHEAAR